jgi:hypothetical protein
MSGLFEDLQRMRGEIDKLPEPIAYIVLDHGTPPGGFDERRDGHGKRYLRASPALLESPFAFMEGIPVYRREDMRDGWPDYA